MEMATSFLGSDFKFTFSSKNTRYLSGLGGGLRHQQHSHGLSSKCFSHFQSLSTRMVAGTTKMASSDVYVGRDTSMRVNNSKMYTKLNSCLVIPPTPNRSKPRAIIKFLGGAFIGAIPEVTYGYYSVLPFVFSMQSLILSMLVNGNIHDGSMVISFVLFFFHF